MTTPDNLPSPPDGGAATTPKPFTMWVAHCPFRKNGSPVLGNMGSSVREVIVMTADEWRRLCAAVPQLATTAFNVGTYE